MFTILKQKIIMLAIFLGFFFVIEILTFNSLGLGNIPSYVLLDLVLVTLIGSIVLLFKSNKFTLVYLSFWMLIFNVLFLTNVTMFKIYGDLFSMDKLLLINEADEVFSWSFINIWDIILAITLLLGFIIVIIFIMRVFKTQKRLYVIRNYHRKHRFSVFLITFLILMIVYSGGGSFASRNIEEGHFTERFYVSTLKKSAFKYYGMLTLYYKEIEFSLTTPNDNPIDDDDPIDDDPVETEYTGLLEGKNVITIMIESAQEFAINPYLTPNLYQLREEGLYFSENYSINKTNVSEQIGITGNYPSSSVSYNISSIEYLMEFSVPNILNDEYSTSYFHDNNGSFYKRDELMRQFSFENYYFHDDLFPEDDLPNWDGHWSWGGNYTLDSITIDRILPYMINEDEPFYSFWTTLSTHGPYNDSKYSNRDLFIKKGYFELIEKAEEHGLWNNLMAGDDLGEFEMKYYQASMIDLDIAIGKLLDELTEKNLLDDTLIILYGDHHVYYKSNSSDVAFHERLHGVTNDEINKVDVLHDTILYMWNPTLNETFESDFGTTTIDTFTSPYVIVPTLLELLGATYDSRWYANLSIFDEEYIPVFYSHQHQALMDNVLYAIDIESITYQAREVDELYLEAFFQNSIRLLERQNYIDELYLRRPPEEDEVEE